MSTPALSEPKLDKYDLRLLARLNAEGPSFMRHPSHEHRAFDMFGKGLLERENAVYKMTQSFTEYRWRYWVTEAGRRALLRVGTGDKP